MPKYVLGFTVLDSRSLEFEEGVIAADVYLSAVCCGKEYQTDILEETGSGMQVWNKKIIWSDIQLLEEEFGNAYIEFAVWTRNWFSRNYCVGKASLQLKSINERSNRAYMKKSIPLIKEGMTEAAGQITLSIYCLKEGESPPNEDDEADDDQKNVENEDLSSAICGLPLKGMVGDGRPHMVFIDLFKICNMPADDWGRFPQPFVTVEFTGNRQKVEGSGNGERCNLNMQVSLPVMTPVYEDTILIKVWSYQMFGADVLLAQGTISFSELRNKPLAPRWFNLYGYDANEITDEQVRAIAREGEQVQPNTFKGQLLMSGRVECYDTLDDPQMKPANQSPTKTSAEPPQVQRTLLGDVYEVCGVVGREAQVEVVVANNKMATKHVVAKWQAAEDDDSDAHDDGEVDDENAEEDEATTFKFTQEKGRIEALPLMMPEDRDSRPLVMVNIRVRGVLSSEARVGWMTRQLHEISRYEVGNPSRPHFYALNPMPLNTGQKVPSSVLMCLEQHTSENVPRHNRKYVKPMKYVIRTYAFLARSIKAEHPKEFALRISCAGTSKVTKPRQEVRPMWMEPLDMKISLNANHKDEPPTMEPITVTLCTRTAAGIYKELGKSICTYEYMRQKDSMGQWEPFKLTPQWIELTGGNYGTIVVGEVLLAFELLQHSAWRDMMKNERSINKDPSYEKLKPKSMWPVDEEEYDDETHFCKLRKATLHFSLLGLRDIIAGKGAVSDVRPEVEVQVKKWNAGVVNAKTASEKYYSMKFSYTDLVDGGNARNKEDKMQNWESTALNGPGRQNYEFFQAGAVNVMIPDMMILEPFLTVKVSMTTKFLAGFLPEGQAVDLVQNVNPFHKPVLVGEHRRSLNSLFPCCWYEGVDALADDAPEGKDLKKSAGAEHIYGAQEALIEKRMEEGESSAKPRRNFEEETDAARKERLDKERKENYEAEIQKLGDKNIKKKAEVQTGTAPDALPPQLHDYNATTNPIGLKKGDKDELQVCKVFNIQAWRGLNMELGTMFSPRIGEISKAKGMQDKQLLDGNYEDKRAKCNPKCDFHYIGQPLLINHDIIDPLADDPVHWHFEYKNCFGFVKCVFKLTDGWEGPFDLDASHGSAEEKREAASKLEELKDSEKALAEEAKELQAEIGPKNLFSMVASLVNKEANAESGFAGGDDTAKQKDVEIDDSDPRVTDAEMVKYPPTGEMLPIYPDEVIKSVKFDFLKAHAKELYHQITAKKKGEALKKIPTVPPREKECRAWVAKIQKAMLKPLVGTAKQKELQKLATDLDNELSSVLAVTKPTEDTWKHLIELVQKLAARLQRQENPERSIKYQDFVRANIRSILKSAENEIYNATVTAQFRVIRKRLNKLEALASSYNFDQDLNDWAFDSRAFFEKYRKETPSRIKVRVYFVKGTVIFGKGASAADPYIRFRIGEEENSMRNSACYNSNEPEFYRSEERDMELPLKCRLQVDLLDVGDVIGAGAVGKQDAFDTLIGSTVIDLEDRWHSKNLTRLTEVGSIPRESRPLFQVSKYGGQQSVMGSLLMWVEMIDSVRAADHKVTPLYRPPPTEVELRFVIFTCESCKLVDNGKIDAKVYCTLQCETYQGPYPNTQTTDVHHGSTGSAIFNWRMVYPKIILPTPSCIVELSLYDYNLIAGDNRVGSISLDVKRYVEKVASSMDTIIKTDNKLRFSGNDEDEGENIGEVKFDMQVLPQSEANRKPSGKARDEPNENPELMTPSEGRGWDSVLPSLGLSFGFGGFYKKVIPLILFTLLCLVGLKQVGLL